MIRFLYSMLLLSMLSACGTTPLLERLRLFTDLAPAAAEAPDGLMAVMPLRGDPGLSLEVNQAVADYFAPFSRIPQASEWISQKVPSEEEMFAPELARILGVVDIQWLLTGRYHPPPKGFLTLELVRVGETYPFWMFGVPWNDDAKGREVAWRALERLKEKMNLRQKRFVFPVIKNGMLQLAVDLKPGAQQENIAPPPSPSVVAEPPPQAVALVVKKEATPPEVKSKIAPSPAKVEAKQQVKTEHPPQVDVPEAVGTSSPPKALTEPVPPSQEDARQYVLQVGVYRQVEEALEMVRKLRDRGYEPDMAQIGAGVDAMAWRVWIGLYDNFLEAKGVAGEFLVREGLPIQVTFLQEKSAPSRYAIQMGGFRDPLKAQALSDALSQKGYPATVQKSMDDAGREWHWVWAGRFWSYAQARERAEEIEAREGAAVFVTPIGEVTPVLTSNKAKLGAYPSNSPFLYAVQVGGFTDEGMAGAMVKRLKDKGYLPRIHNHTDHNGRLWRMIWIGRYAGFSKARKVREAYQRKEGQPAFVTPVPASGGGNGKTFYKK